jgi:malic enzyme
MQITLGIAKNKMMSSSLVQSRESLISTVGSVQTDSDSWLGLVPGCLQASKAILVGENIVILLFAAISIIPIPIRDHKQIQIILGIKTK